MKIKEFTGGSLQSNGYIIWVRDGGECYVIDPGYAPRKFITYIEKEGLSMKGILLTHNHRDHVGGAAKIAEYFQCPVMMHRLDAAGYGGKVDVEWQDGDTLYLDGEELRVLSTPGHTEGSVCIVSETSKVVFSGDTVFDTDLGRTDLEGGSPEAMAESCRRVVNTWPDDYMIYPGHDEGALMEDVRRYNQEFLDCLEKKNEL